MQLKHVILLIVAVAAGLVAIKMLSGSPHSPTDPGGEPAETVQEALDEARRQLADIKAHPEKYLPREKTPREKSIDWFGRRPVPPPLLAWLFDETTAPARMPIGGTLLVNVQSAGGYALDPSGTLVPSPAGYVCFEGARLLSTTAGEALCDRIRSKNAFSMELILRPSHARHRGPARIVSLSWDGNKRNFTFAQEDKQWVIRLRTSESDENGTRPEVRLGNIDGTRTHIVVAYDANGLKVFVNGRAVAVEAELRGDLSNWEDDFPLVLANEAYAARPWEGVLRWVAFYDRVLSEDEVNHCVGHLPPDDPPLAQHSPQAPNPPDGHAPADDTDF